MEKKYLAQIIATDNEGLQMIQRSSGAKVRVSILNTFLQIKFLLSIERNKKEKEQENKIKSICRFDFDIR